MDVPVPVITLYGIQLSGTRVLSLLLSVVAMVGLDLLLRRTRFGMAVRATILDRDAATLMGINRRFILVSTFAVGSALSRVVMLLIGSMYGVVVYISLKYNQAITMSLLVLMLILRPSGFLGKQKEENI